MARSTKWIKGSTAKQHVSEVAKKAIHVRLRRLCEILPKAVMRADEDVEFVHQLRVESRRSMASLQMFDRLLPRKRTARLKKMLRRVRRAAGNRRDLDVLLDRLSQRARQTPGSGIDQVLAGVTQRHVESHLPLSEVYRFWIFNRYDRRIAAILKRIRWRDAEKEPRFQSTAQAALDPVVKEFFQVSQVDLTDVNAIHRMRISGKRLRYTMELTAGAFDREFREDLYATFADVQDRLGQINDHATAEALLTRWADESADGQESAVLQQLAALEQRRLGDTCESLRNWWTPARSLQLQSNFSPYISPKPSTRS